MAYAGKLIVKLENSNVNPLNFQIVDFDFNTAAGTLDECAAGVIAYLLSCGASDAIAANSGIVEIQHRDPGSSGGVPVAFPAAAYTALMGTATPPPAIGVAAFPVGLGTGVLAPLGTSISVSERTAHAGPSGRGRHFLPFTSRNAVNSAGTLVVGIDALIGTYYDEFIAGDAIGIDLIPVVRAGGTYSGGYPITLVKAQPVFSNLESRRR